MIPGSFQIACTQKGLSFAQVQFSKPVTGLGSAILKSNAPLLVQERKVCPFGKRQYLRPFPTGKGAASRVKRIS
ncbi:hypothetical protein JCM30471_07590 [Desulfuromonas carbonis]